MQSWGLGEAQGRSLEKSEPMAALTLHIPYSAVAPFPHFWRGERIYFEIGTSISKGQTARRGNRPIDRRPYRPTGLVWLGWDCLGQPLSLALAPFRCALLQHCLLSPSQTLNVLVVTILYLTFRPHLPAASSGALHAAAARRTRHGKKKERRLCVAAPVALSLGV